MPQAWLVDTDVLIDYLRGYERAVAWLDSLNHPPLISVLTITELYAGAREPEHEALHHFFGAFVPIEIGADIAKQAGLYRRQYGGSHGTGVVDAIIAACAEAANATLATLNTKHFPMLQRVERPYEKN